MGKAPLVEFGSVFGASNPVFAKLEYMNPSGSIKDRPVLNILKKAMTLGKLGRGDVVVEATTGNTGIALAYWANVLGLKAVIVIAKNVSLERKKMLSLLGAEIIEAENVPEAEKLAKKLAKEKGWFYLGQFDREENPEAYKELAREIEDVGAEIFVAGVGTGGTLIGVARYFAGKIVAVFPAERNHGIQGIGDGIMGKFWDWDLVDEVVRVSTKDAMAMTKRLWRAGFLTGISSGANALVSLKKAKEGTVATVFPDSWDRYFSVF